MSRRDDKGLNSLTTWGQRAIGEILRPDSHPKVSWACPKVAGMSITMDGAVWSGFG